jgi:CheY-like chemotaxis protein
VTLCGDGVTLLDTWQKHEFDLVLMDIQMPVMDGLEATRRIRDEESAAGRRRTPIVAMTACALNRDRDRGFHAGVDGYLTKPICIHALDHALSNFAAHPAAGASPSHDAAILQASR